MFFCEKAEITVQQSLALLLVNMHISPLGVNSQSQQGYFCTT